MKKLLIALLVVFLAVVAVLGLSDSKLVTEIPEAPAAETAAAEPETAEAAEEPVQASSGVDYEAIYALHDPEEIVMTIDGREICWEDYFYSYASQASDLEEQFQMYQAYGYAMGWNSAADEEGHTYAELLGSVAEKNLRRIVTVESVAEENGVTLNEEEERSLQESHRENIEWFCGEDGTEEQLFEQLAEQHLRPELYWRVMRFGSLAQATRRTLFGEEGELLSEQQVLDWMEENGILSANHILLTTVDLSSYPFQPLDEATVAEKTALAQQIAEELQAIEDPQEREARFLELKEQYCEDGNDYVFGPGVMVDEFYDGALALEEGQVSDPVLSQYGYHVILRRPLHADDLVFTGSADESARSLALDQLFSALMQQRMNDQIVEYAPGFQAPAVLDYYRLPEA